MEIPPAAQDPATRRFQQPLHLPDAADIIDANDLLDEEARRIVADIGIPPCPVILTKLLREMRKDDPDFPAIGKMLGSDLSLAASMLKTVNSPFYGLGRKATSVQQALTLLGLQNVARLVTGLLLRQAFPVAKSETMEAFWDSAAHIADATALIARELRCADRDEAYTFGLFRDCGMPLMACKYPNYDAVLARAQSPNAAQASDTLIDAEEDEFAVNHAIVGYYMASSWYLTEDLCQAILHHHDVDALASPTPSPINDKVRHLVAIGFIAEHLHQQISRQDQALTTSTTPSPDIDADLTSALELLGISPERLAELASVIVAARREESHRV